MSRPSNAEKLANKHEFFLTDFDKIQAATRDTRIQCLSDRRFYSIPGAQWEGPVGEQFINKPRFEFNKTHLAVLRVVNEYRNNRITVDFIPKDGTDADQLADTCAGLYRADEQDSGAQEAYDNCFEEGTSGGMGAIRLRARYEDEDDDEDDRQRIAIEPIYEADSCVFFSLDGKRYDKADAKRCYVLSSMTPDAYAEEWGDDPASMPKTVQRSFFDWCQPDVVWVAEVYEIEEKTQLVHYFRGIALDDSEPNEMMLTDDELAEPGKAEELAATGFKAVRQKRRKIKRVHKYIMNGARILSDEGYIAGNCIPVIPFYGKRWFVDGIERMQGHVRLARDAQVLDNMIKSWLAEMAMRFDIEKPIFSPEQIAGHAQIWAADTIEKYPYLLANSLLDASGLPIPGSNAPVAYTKAPNMPPAMAALAQLAADALEDMLGNQQAGEQLQPNQSGYAQELIQQRLDMQVFIYIDNFKKMIKRAGEVWLSMAKDLLVDPGRKMKTVGQAGETGTIELLKPMIDKESGESFLSNDMSEAKFDIVPDVGPSSSSRRAATVRALMNVLQTTQDPETQQVLTAMVMMNMEGEGLQDVRAYYRKKLVQMGVIEPTDEEKQEMQAQAQQQASTPPDANTQFLLASAGKAAADTKQSLAKTDLANAQAEAARATAVATIAGVNQDAAAHALDIVRHLDGMSLETAQMAQDANQAAQQQAAAPAQQTAPADPQQ